MHHRKNIIKDFTTLGANRKWSKSLFKNGYLASLCLAIVWGGMHIGKCIKLFNRCHRSHIGVTISINNKLTHLASNRKMSVEDFLPFWLGVRGTCLAWRSLWTTNSSPTSKVIEVWFSSSKYCSLVSSYMTWSSSTSLVVRVVQLGEAA